MNAPLDLRLPKQEFDRWVSRQRERFEWKDGRVVQMNNVTRGHSKLVVGLIVALSSRLDPRLWTVAAPMCLSNAPATITSSVGLTSRL